MTLVDINQITVLSSFYKRLGQAGHRPSGRGIERPYPLSYRQLEEMMEERDISVDHSTIHRRCQINLPPCLASTPQGILAT
jgi:transposase-like protein